MTKKDYDIIAACIGAAQADPNNFISTVNDISNRLILEMTLENPKFNESLFWERVEYWRKSHSNEN